MKKENLQRITAFRQELHRHPELSLQETDTIKRVRAFLSAYTAFSIEERDGWLFAVKEGKTHSGRSIAFRADMDALPIDETGMGLPYESVCRGVSHKCGHDGHTAALCGLALELDAADVEKTVFLIFQGAEEIGEGAKKAAMLVREKNIQEVYAFHNLPGYPEGEVVYRRGLTQPASEGLTICFHGRTSHASAPEEGANPAAVIADTILHSRKMSEKPREGMVLCTVAGVKAGSGDFGISAGEGALMLTLRAENEMDMKALENEIREFAKQKAEARGIRTEFQISDYFPETRNHEDGIQKVLSAAECRNIPVREMRSMWRASEDFGYYLKECGGAMVYIGDGGFWPPLHTKEYDFNDRILETAVDLFCALALA